MNHHNLSLSPVLLIDDDPADREFIEECLRINGMQGEIHSFASGSSAILYLQGIGAYADRERYPYPSIVITDLKMAGGDGFDVLEHLKEDPNFAIVPVLVLSNSADEDDVRRAYRMGASSFIQKPLELEDLRHVLKVFYQFWQLCAIPDVEDDGRQSLTDHRGKLGERYGRVI